MSDSTLERVVDLVAKIRLKRLLLEKENMERIIQIEHEIYRISTEEEIKSRSLSVMAAVARQILQINLEILACESLAEEGE